MDLLSRDAAPDVGDGFLQSLRALTGRTKRTRILAQSTYSRLGSPAANESIVLADEIDGVPDSLKRLTQRRNLVTVFRSNSQERFVRQRLTRCRGREIVERLFWRSDRARELVGFAADTLEQLNTCSKRPHIISILICWHGSAHCNPACFQMLCSSPPEISSLGWPLTVTLPALTGRVN